MSPWKYRELTGRPPPRRGLLGLGIGAGLCGMLGWLGLRFFIRPATAARVPETISPPAFTTRVFRSHGGGMVYHEASGGEGSAARPALVFVHGIGVGASSYEWSKVTPAFAGTHRVLTPDLIGFGESERPRLVPGAAEHVRILAEFLENVIPDGNQDGGRAAPAVLIARGLAAGLCARLAAERPELVARLVCILPRGASEAPPALRFAARLPTLGRLVYRNFVARSATIRRHLETRLFADPRRVTEEAVEMHRLCAQQYQAGFTVRAAWRGALDVRLEQHFRALRCPALVLVPGHAPERVRGRARRLDRVNERVTVRELPGLGTLAALEDPARVATLVAAELAPAATDAVGLTA